MCPEEQSRPFLTYRTIDKARYDKATAIAERFVWFASEEQRRSFWFLLLGYDTYKANRPYKPKAKKQTLRRVGKALAELINALEAMDFESRARLGSYEHHADSSAKETLRKSEIGLNHWFLYQELMWIQPAWNTAIEAFIADLPAASPTGREKTTRKDELIDELAKFFRSHARAFRGETAKQREQSFVNAILASIGESPLADVTERVRKLERKKRDAQAKAEKRSAKKTEKPVQTES